MWGIFVGLGLGLLQAVLLRKTAEWITADKRRGTAIAVPIILIKLLVIIGILYLLARVSIETLLWGAGGMLITMIGYPVIVNIRASRKNAAAEQAAQLNGEAGDDK